MPIIINGEAEPSPLEILLNCKSRILRDAVTLFVSDLESMRKHAEIVRGDGVERTATESSVEASAPQKTPETDNGANPVKGLEHPSKAQKPRPFPASASMVNDDDRGILFRQGSVVKKYSKKQRSSSLCWRQKQGWPLPTRQSPALQRSPS